MVDSLAKLSMDVGDKDLVYSLLLVFSGMLMDKKGCARDNITMFSSLFDVSSPKDLSCAVKDGENPCGVQKGFKAMVFHPEQAGSSEATGLEAHHGRMNEEEEKFVALNRCMLLD
ncbi:MMS19 nucleotide excision repair protein-like protein [Zea mays]|uniref:MMS19 nucleotide excision repair protein-like protein n=1 Tax=Zea mays TaxID=4577 RepID=A0A1D6L9Y4_MAIZE|nr:MMS19 nucleotide excision repair protein-like protein [Zea mays]